MSTYRGKPRGFVFTDAQAQRIVDLAWDVQHLLPHPDDVSSPEDADALREFHRAITLLPPLPEDEKRKR